MYIYTRIAPSGAPSHRAAQAARHAPAHPASNHAEYLDTPKCANCPLYYPQSRISTAATRQLCRVSGSLMYSVSLHILSQIYSHTLHTCKSRCLSTAMPLAFRMSGGTRSFSHVYLGGLGR